MEREEKWAKRRKISSALSPGVYEESEESEENEEMFSSRQDGGKSGGANNGQGGNNGGRGGRGSPPIKSEDDASRPARGFNRKPFNREPLYVSLSARKLQMEGGGRGSESGTGTGSLAGRAPAGPPGPGPGPGPAGGPQSPGPLRSIAGIETSRSGAIFGPHPSAPQATGRGRGAGGPQGPGRGAQSGHPPVSASSRAPQSQASPAPAANTSRPTTATPPGPPSDSSRLTTSTSEWYKSIDPRAKTSRSIATDLRVYEAYYKSYQRALPGSPDQAESADKLRMELGKLSLWEDLRGPDVKKSKVLEEERGLPVIFNDPGLPWDIRADARAIFNRWIAGDLDGYLFRGMSNKNAGQTGQGQGQARFNHSLARDARKRNAAVVGANGLVNGQWWPLQLCAVRDGAHGEIEAGIHGKPGQGAFSVIMSSGGYDDRDHGDEVEYCGTAGQGEGKLSTGTKHLLETWKRKNPVRVLRSAGIPQHNPYRPEKGVRYDGLYDVTGFEVINRQTQMHRFRLVRQLGQDPIRYRGGERRPSQLELSRYDQIRGNLGIKPKGAWD